jgi:hypothetical protein
MDAAMDVEFAAAGAVKGSVMVHLYLLAGTGLEWYRVVPVPICYGTGRYQRKGFLE